jgi:Fungal specific transcription factor domain
LTPCQTGSRPDAAVPDSQLLQLTSKHAQGCRGFSDDLLLSPATAYLPHRFVLPPPITTIQAGNADPFSSTAVPLTSNHAKILQFAVDLRTRLVWPTEMALRRNHGPLHDANIASHAFCLRSPATMYGLLAYSYSWLSRLSPELAPTYRQAADKHLSLAVKELTTLLESDRDSEDLKGMLQATVYLACVESHRSSYENTMIHLNATKRILHLIGGIQALHWVYQEALINVFLTFAGNITEPSSLNPDEWDPGHLSLQNWWQRRKDWHIPPTSSLQHSSLNADRLLTISCDSNALYRILSALRELVVIEGLKLKQAKNSSPDVNLMFRWSLRRRYAVRAHILQYWYDHVQRDKVSYRVAIINPHVLEVKHSSPQICVCWATRLFELALLEQIPPSTGKWVRQVEAVHATLLKCVKNVLTSDGLGSDRFCISLDFLWICSVGACFEHKYLVQTTVSEAKCGFQDPEDPEEVFDLPGSDRRWFSSAFTMCSGRFKSLDFSCLVDVLAETYVYSKISQEGILEGLFGKSL